MEHHRDARIRSCQNQVIAHLSANPHESTSTSKVSGTVTDGLKCTVRQGDHQANMDMREAMGGDGTAPSPSFFANAGLVGCVAIATKMTAARNGLHVRSVNVEIESDSDTLALFELGGRNAAPLDTRIRIFIDTDAPDEAIENLIVHVLTVDTWFLALRDPQSVSVAWQRHALLAEEDNAAT